MNIFTFFNFKCHLLFFFSFPGTDGLLQGNFFDKLNATLLSSLVTQEKHLFNLTSTLQKSSNWINYGFNSEILNYLLLTILIYFVLISSLSEDIFSSLIL